MENNFLIYIFIDITLSESSITGSAIAIVVNYFNFVGIDCMLL